VPDVAMTEPIHKDLARRGLLPDEHYVDSGYPSADLLVSSLTGSTPGGTATSSTHAGPPHLTRLELTRAA
jgi:hypothetical protein